MIIKVKPFLKQKEWGNENLSTFFITRKNKNKLKNIGEAILLSGLKNEESELINEDLTLNDFYKNNKEKFKNYPSNNFPLLVKIVDVKKNTPLCVDPNDSEAQLLDNYEFGRAKGWYIIDTKQRNNIYIGTKFKNIKQLKKSLVNGTLISNLNTFECHPREIYNIIPGTINGLKKGATIYSVSQSSNITYRILDNTHPSNFKRELQIEKALKVVKFNTDIKQERRIKLFSDDIIVEESIRNKYFELDRIIITGKTIYQFDLNKNFIIITIIEGEIKINNIKYKKFDTLLITSDSLNKDIFFNGNAILLATNPANY